MRFARLTQIATALTALAIGSQTHAAPIQYGTYYDETAPAVPAGRRLRPDLVDNAVAERVAKIFARAGQRIVQLAMGGRAVAN